MTELEVPAKAKVWTWEEFKNEVGEMRSKASHAPVLFRGQEHASWSLDTTLERSGHGESVAGYYKLVLRIRSEIETATGKAWPESPQFPELDDMVRSYDGFSLAMVNLPHYRYLAHLRHHGFPSPLLDWSESPFVAAYFAFRSGETVDREVAIYAYLDRIGSFKTTSSERAQIQHLGPYVSAHRRHFLQKSHYTICVQWFNDQWYFVGHGTVFDEKSEMQNVLTKFVLNATERDVILRELNDYNLNAYSLFGSEDALMEALSIREELRIG
jgi:hypothetical protein